MNLYELISLNRAMLKTMHKNGIKISDYKYLEIYEKYLEMTKNGDKITYIVANLSNIFEVGERTVYRIIELFQTTAIF